MLRLSLLTIVIAACASTPRRPVANAASGTSYALQPIRLHGGEGRHSASQSWTSISGALELKADEATLALEMTTARSYIRCPKDRLDHGRSMQACAPEGAKDSSVANKLTMTGSSRWVNGKLTITVRKDDTAATLTCTEQGRGLACAIDDDYTLSGHVGDRPHQIVFTPDARLQAPRA